VDGDIGPLGCRPGCGDGDKLAAVGLILDATGTLQAFLDSYIKGRTDVKLRTTWKYETTGQNRLDFLGRARTPRHHAPAAGTIGGCRLAERGLAEQHRRKHTGHCQAIFPCGQAETTDRRESLC